jgi:hypothetical protein
VTYKPGAQGTFAVTTTSGLHYDANTPDAPTITGAPGWTFAGWNPARTAKVTGDAIYTAQWTQDKYTVTYKPGDHGTFSETPTGNLI